MVTLGQEIITRYQDTQKKVEAEIGSFPLPKLGDDISLSDFIVFVIMEFSPLYESRNFRPKIDMAVRLRRLNLTKEQVDKVYPDIEAYLLWLIPLLKERGG